MPTLSPSSSGGSSRPIFKPADLIKMFGSGKTPVLVGIPTVRR
jgi:hypothetical protein